MRTNPTLLLLLLLIFVFSAPIEDWMTHGSGWYKPYLVWLIVIAFVYWGQRGNDRNEF